MRWYIFIAAALITACFGCFSVFASLDEPEAGETTAPIIEVDTVEPNEPEAGESSMLIDETHAAELDEPDEPETLIPYFEKTERDETAVSIEPFASGVIVGELADLLQDNLIDNDGYTDESWQRYETAVAAGWDAIANFMTYTNEDVRTVIDELQAAISGLERPANPALPIEFDSEIVVAGLFSVVGSVAGLAFITKWNVGA